MKPFLSVPLLPGLRADNNNTPVTFEALKETFGAKGQAQYIDYLDDITGPQGAWPLDPLDQSFGAK
jgi:hypothetical protein